MNQVNLNALPRYSARAKALLLDSTRGRVNRSSEDLLREFNIDKWGRLNDELDRLPLPTVHDADKLATGNDNIVFSIKDELFSAPALDVHNRYLDLVSHEIQDSLAGATGLVELGAGYGTIIFNLAVRKILDGLRLFALELTENGQRLMNSLSKSLEKEIEIGGCDFGDLNLRKLKIPENSVFLTSWSMAYLKSIPSDCFQEIIYHRPRLVIHFEPILEHCDDDTVLGLLRRKYLKLNNYDSDLLSRLHKLQENKVIRITYESKSVFGENPLAPVSIIKWTTW